MRVRVVGKHKYFFSAAYAADIRAWHDVYQPLIIRDTYKIEPHFAPVIFYIYAVVIRTEICIRWRNDKLFGF